MNEAREIAKLIQRCIDASKYGMRTHFLGQVVEYDKSTNLAVIQPIPKSMPITDAENLETLNITIIRDVPVHQYGSGKLWCTVAPKVGTYGLCHVSDRAIDNWLISGGDEPSDVRCHHFSDAIFDPSLIHLVVDGDNGAFDTKEEIQDDRISFRTRTGITEVSVLEDETILIQNDKATITIDTDGTVNLSIDGGATLDISDKDSDTIMTIGDGAVGIALGPALQNYINNTVKVWADAHTHPTGVGPSGPPATPLTGYDTAITSTKIIVPDG